MWSEIFTALLIVYIFWDIMKVLNSPLRAIPGPILYKIPILGTHMIFSPLFYGEIFGKQKIKNLKIYLKIHYKKIRNLSIYY